MAILESKWLSKEDISENLVIKSMYFRVRLPGFKSQLHYLQIMWRWANYLTSLWHFYL